MDMLKNALGSGSNANKDETVAQASQTENKQSLTDRMNSMLGGGKASEANEDAVDKTVDWVQEHVLGQGDQSNESAFEQAKDEQISDGE